MSNETYFGYEYEFTNEIDIKSWNESYSQFNVQNQETDDEKFLYTLPVENNHVQQAEEIIDYAVSVNKPLFVTSFIISYKKVIDKLIDANKVLKGKIFILTPIEKNALKSVLINSKEIEEHLSGIQQLVKAGIRIRSVRNGHWKMLLAGTDRGLITSANITQVAYEKNPEFGIYLTDKRILYEIKNWFVEVWKKSAEKEVLPNNKIYDLTQTPFTFSRPRISENKELTMFNAYNNTGPYTRLLQLIGQANKEIKILTYLLLDKKIIEKLRAKAEDGVKIIIVLPLLRSTRIDVLNAVKKLEHKNIEIRKFLETHAKAIIIDEKTILYSTGNFDDYLKKGTSLDIVIELQNQALIQNFLKFFDWTYKNSAKQQETLYVKNLGFEKEIGILIPSPLEVIPNLSLSLEGLIESWKKAEITFFEQEDAILIKTDRATFLWYLEKSGEQYKIKSSKKNSYDFQGKEGIIYESIKFNFVWLDFPGMIKEIE